MSDEVWLLPLLVTDPFDNAVDDYETTLAAP
jgi:hypothetical protein